MTTTDIRGERLPLRLRTIAAVLGAAAGVARRVLPASRTERATPAGSALRILVVRLDELGDMVLFSGFFRELRRRYPDADVTLVAKPAGAEIMAGSPHLDRIIPFRPSPPRALRPILMPFLARHFVRRHLHDRTFDIAIQPRWDFDGMYAGWLIHSSNAPVRVAFSERVSERKSVFSRGMDRLYTLVVDGRGVQHESEHTNDILRALGADGDGSVMEVWPASPSALPQASSMRTELPRDDRPVVAFGPSGGHSALKAWPIDRFAQVARELSRSAGAHIVVLGTAADRDLAAAIARASGVSVIDLTGRTTLAQTVAVLDGCALYIGNDTGLLHIAAARGVPTVSIFGPSPASRFGPRGPRHTVFWAKLPCGPLPDPDAAGGPVARGLRTERCARCLFAQPRCMEAITPTAVARAGLKILELSRTTRVPPYTHSAAV